MPDTSWALVHDEGRPPDTLAGLVIERTLVDPADPSVRVLLERWGAFVAAAPPHRAFAATADNVTILDDHLDLASDLRAGVDPLDDDATAARLCWHLARTLVVAGAAADPDRTVARLAERLSGVAALAFTDAGLARALAHEAATQARVDHARVDHTGSGPDTAAALAEQYARESAWTMTAALDAGAIAPDAQRAALRAAWADLARTRRDRDRAEADAIGHVAARALATDLGEVLERDEWIRARLRNVKSTTPVRALIAARKRATALLRRG